jgi:hypothetical protein
MSGYLHRAYAESLVDLGTPRALPRSGGWLLVRPVSGTPWQDAMGCYPLFACRDWSRLAEDLEETGRDLVAVSLVADPFGSFSERDLERCFPDRLLPFKEHFTVDLTRAPESFIAENHRRNVRKALQAGLTVERCADPMAYLDDWVRLYGVLSERHRIRGFAAFSARSFALQLAVPGMVLLRAVTPDGQTAGITLWAVQGEIGYYHLGAYSLAGYERGASFVLFDRAIRSFAADGLRWLSLGAGAGLGGGEEDGLSRFKRGWATGTRTAWLCGRIFDRAAYSSLAGESAPEGFFPAYRRVELVGAPA